jgi:hypothetical protein
MAQVEEEVDVLEQEQQVSGRVILYVVKLVSPSKSAGESQGMVESGWTI